MNSVKYPRTGVEVLLVAEPLGELLVVGLVGVEVESVQHGEGLLGVAVLQQRKGSVMKVTTYQ